LAALGCCLLQRTNRTIMLKKSIRETHRVQGLGNRGFNAHGPILNQKSVYAAIPYQTLTDWQNGSISACRETGRIIKSHFSISARQHFSTSAFLAEMLTG
ncbi:MAG: hypothetical protein KC421_12655, partial [Anaerolineales bacterium]|nr:hypothetical protein [Anaerolineales bacterium]